MIVLDRDGSELRDNLTVTMANGKGLRGFGWSYPSDDHERAHPVATRNRLQTAEQGPSPTTQRPHVMARLSKSVVSRRR